MNETRNEFSDHEIDNINNMSEGEDNEELMNIKEENEKEACQEMNQNEKVNQSKSNKDEDKGSSQ